MGNGSFSDILSEALGLQTREPQLVLKDLAVPRPFFNAHCEDNFMYCPQQIVISSSSRYNDLDWICKPRKKPKMDADSSHEFEGFSGTVVGTRIEWTFTGHIVSYCDGSLLLWNPSEEVITKYDFNEHVVTLAHHPHYRFLATSIQHKFRNFVKVWSMKNGAMLSCFCYTPKRGGIITTLCWNKLGIHLISGNAQGSICTLDFYGAKQVMHRTSSRLHSMIRDLKFSASGCYLASLDILGKLCIWSYNSGFLKLHHVWDSTAPASPTAIDWHPWTDTDLVLCLKRDQMLTILNVQSKKSVALAKATAFQFNRPVISFNKISAELVVGCSRTGELIVESVPLIRKFLPRYSTGCGVQKNVIVLGAIDNIVDELNDVGAINTSFMWSPNHEQLAFIAGHDIQIYNFFGPTTSSLGAPGTRNGGSTNMANLTTNRSIFKEFEFIK